MTVSPPIDMTVFQNAIHNWYSTATGIQTMWQDQSVPRPDYPYASLSIISGPLPVSPLWEQRQSFDASRPGEEIEFSSCVPCTFVIGTQVYTSQPDAINPAYSSLQYAARAQAALAIPSYRATLRAVGISVIEKGTVTNINELVDDAYVSRSGLDVTLGASLSVESYETYIEKVEISSTSLGIDMEVSL